MTQVPPTAGSVCYRHPDRTSFIACQRCGRTICPECQTPGAVGVICPECMAQQRASAPRTKPRFVSNITAMTRRGQPVVTYSIIALCVVIFAAQMVGSLLGDDVVTEALLYAPAYSNPLYGIGFEPWRLLTSAFVHSTSLTFGILPIHILLNMYTLWIFGLALESLLGRGRYLALYLISAFAGSLGVMLIAAPNSAVVGASGAIFGLMGAFFVIQRHLGGNATQLLILVGLNLVIGFAIPGIAWEAHVGGLIGGVIVGFIYTRTRNRSQRKVQIGSIAALCAVLVAVSCVHLL